MEIEDLHTAKAIRIMPNIGNDTLLILETTEGNNKVAR
jgi:hypothetical protein